MSGELGSFRGPQESGTKEGETRIRGGEQAAISPCGGRKLKGGVQVAERGYYTQEKAGSGRGLRALNLPSFRKPAGDLQRGGSLDREKP